MTLDDAIFAIESGAESVAILKRYKEQVEAQAAPLFVEMIHNAYGEQRRAYERLAESLGIINMLQPAILARQQKAAEEYNAWKSKTDAEAAAKKADEEAGKNPPGWNSVGETDPLENRDDEQKVVATLPIQNDEF